MEVERAAAERMVAGWMAGLEMMEIVERMACVEIMKVVKVQEAMVETVEIATSMVAEGMVALTVGARRAVPAVKEVGRAAEGCVSNGMHIRVRAWCQPASEL